MKQTIAIAFVVTSALLGISGCSETKVTAPPPAVAASPADAIRQPVSEKEQQLRAAQAQQHLIRDPAVIAQIRAGQAERREAYNQRAAAHRAAREANPANPPGVERPQEPNAPR